MILFESYWSLIYSLISFSLFVTVVIVLIPELRNIAITTCMKIFNYIWLYMKRHNDIEVLNQLERSTSANQLSQSRSNLQLLARSTSSLQAQQKINSRYSLQEKDDIPTQQLTSMNSSTATQPQVQVQNTSQPPIRPTSSFSTPMSKSSSSSKMTLQSPLPSSLSTESIQGTSLTPQTAEVECYIKAASHWVSHYRKITLDNCSLQVFKKGVLEMVFDFTGGKIVQSRTPNAIKIVSPDSIVFYIYFDDIKTMNEWVSAINNNLRIIIAMDWSKKAKVMRMKQTEELLVQQRLNASSN